MNRIHHYSPPTPEELASLREQLGFTTAQMAAVAGLAQDSQWRKYTGRAQERTLGKHMHFHMAAMLTLTDSELARVVACMRDHGAEVEISPLPRAGRKPKV